MNLYGIIISLSIFVSAVTAEKLVKEERKNTDILWGGVFWAVISGLLGARLFHVVHLLPYYLENPQEILALWHGGMAIIGGIFGGVAGLLIYLKKKSKNPIYWLDIGAVVLPLGQAIGRWGNYFNQEIYGPPTALPWGIYIDPENRPVGLKSSERYHPLFFYESLLDLVLFLALLYVFKKHRKKLKKGSIFTFYLIGYSIIRFILEFFRADPLSVWTFGVINLIQVMLFIIFAASIYYLKSEK